MTFQTLLLTNRIAAAALVVGLLVIMVGPFQGVERILGLNDSVAHAIAFYGLSLMVFAVAPTWRRNDLAVAVFGIGVLVELAQGLMGRSASVLDLCANSVGIAAAVLPSFVERLRHETRRHPHSPVSELARLDRRRSKASALPAASRLTRREALRNKS